MGTFKSAAVAALLFVMLFPALCAAQSFNAYIEPTGGVYDVRVSDAGLCLERASFAAAGQDTRFGFRADRVQPDASWVYEYFRVGTTGLSVTPQDTVLDFRISKAWMNETNADIKTATLNFFDETTMSWEIVRSVKYSEDATSFHFRAEPPALSGFFAVTAEPVPVQITFVVQCNRNGACEPGMGEDAETCGDCAPELSYSKCAPLSSYCSEDWVVSCNGDGSDYESTECANGCYNGRCIELPPATGMFLNASPIFMGVIVLLVSVIAYMLFSLRGMRRRISSVEKLR